MKKPDATRERADIVARKANDAAKSDPELEQCVIAYVNWVKDFGPTTWETFRQDWYRRKDIGPPELKVIEANA